MQMSHVIVAFTSRPHRLPYSPYTFLSLILCARPRYSRPSLGHSKPACKAPNKLPVTYLEILTVVFITLALRPAGPSETPQLCLPPVPMLFLRQMLYS